MKLRTSFFNGRILLRDFLRFWPVWGSYLALLLLSFGWFAGNVFGQMTWPMFFYAGICAIALFGDLLVPRRCHALHAMPVRRECWFLTQTAAGLLFFFVPTCLVSLGIAVVWDNPYRWQMIAGFLGSSSLQYVFFFGVALVCIMLSGNRIGTGLMYAGINLLAPVVQWIFTQLYEPFLYSVPVGAFYFEYLSPVLRMAQNTPRFYYFYDCGGFQTFWSGDLQYFLICAGIGIVFGALALLLYRRRKLECAGDLISVRWLGHIFVTVLSVMFGVLVFSLMGHDVNHFWPLAPYVLIGFFGGRMLLKQQVKVFQPGGIIGALCLLLALFGSVWMTRTDALGVMRYVPDPEKVSTVHINLTDSNQYQYRHFVQEQTTVVSSESIGQITWVHRALTEEPATSTSTHPLLYITYKMKNGMQLRRYLPIDKESDAFRELNKTLSSWQVLFEGEDLQYCLDNVTYIQVVPNRTVRTVYFCDPQYPVTPTTSDITVLRKDMRQKALAMLLKECDAGYMRQDRGIEVVNHAYTVTTRIQKEDGAEKEFVFHVFSDLNFGHYMKFCTDVGMDSPNQTITQTTEVPVYPY